MYAVLFLALSYTQACTVTPASVCLGGVGEGCRLPAAGCQDGDVGPLFRFCVC